MPATAEPPAAPAAPAATPTPAAAPGGPTQVPAAAVPAAVEPTPTAKPGSAKARMFAELQKSAKTEPSSSPEPSPTPQPAATPKTGDGQPPVPDRGAKGTEPPAPAAGTPSSEPEPEKGKKASPWKLMDQFKERALKAETDLAEVRKLIPNEAEAKAQQERLKTAEARVEELEKHIRFVDYSKSKEFAEKYQKPYDEAWQRAAKDLAEIPFRDPGTGQTRAAEPNDLLALINAPLGQARAMAKEAFGDFADDVMSWRGKIKDLFDRQNAALREASENGAKWQADQIKQTQSQIEQLEGDVTKLWQRSKEEVMKHPEIGKLLTPVDGDAEINQRLERGIALVDEAFKVNPMDPRLTPEQRTRAVQLHSALRHRAAITGRVLLENKRLTAKLAELEKKLKGIETSTPPITPTPAGGNSPGAPSGWAALRADLEKRAK